MKGICNSSISGCTFAPVRSLGGVVFMVWGARALAPPHPPTHRLSLCSLPLPLPPPSRWPRSGLLPPLAHTRCSVIPPLPPAMAALPVPPSLSPDQLCYLNGQLPAAAFDAAAAATAAGATYLDLAPAFAARSVPYLSAARRRTRPPAIPSALSGSGAVLRGRRIW